MTEPAAWLEERLEGAPASLRQAISQALGGNAAGAAGAADAAGFATLLRETGERLLESAKRNGADRRGALTLLAADACITLAAEWTAETDPAKLAEFR